MPHLKLSNRKAVRVMEEMTGVKLEREEKEEKVNVCKAFRDIKEEERAEGRNEGKECEQRLTKYLLQDNRIEDLKRSLDDEDFRSKLLKEYGIE